MFGGVSPRVENGGLQVLTNGSQTLTHLYLLQHEPAKLGDTVFPGVRNTGIDTFRDITSFGVQNDEMNLNHAGVWNSPETLFPDEPGSRRQALIRGDQDIENLSKAKRFVIDGVRWTGDAMIMAYLAGADTSSAETMNVINALQLYNVFHSLPKDPRDMQDQNRGVTLIASEPAYFTDFLSDLIENGDTTLSRDQLSDLIRNTQTSMLMGMEMDHYVQKINYLKTGLGVGVLGGLGVISVFATLMRDTRKRSRRDFLKKFMTGSLFFGFPVTGISTISISSMPYEFYKNYLTSKDGDRQNIAWYLDNDFDINAIGSYPITAFRSAKMISDGVQFAGGESTSVLMGIQHLTDAYHLCSSAINRIKFFEKVIPQIAGIMLEELKSVDVIDQAAQDQLMQSFYRSLYQTSIVNVKFPERSSVNNATHILDQLSQAYSKAQVTTEENKEIRQALNNLNLL